MKETEHLKTCKVCGEKIKNASHFYRKHKISKQAYIEKYFPKNDLLTGERIPFKNEKSYFERDFKNKRNLVGWLKKQDRATSQNYILDLYRARVKEKGLSRAMGQVELRTSWIPAINIIEKYFDSYDDVCERLGLERSIGECSFGFDIKKNLSIGIDTREQKPLKFPCKTTLFKLDCGDYTALGENFENIFVDRKSPGDFLGTMSGGFDRFCREIERAKLFDAYVVVLVEQSLSKMQGFEYSYHGKHTKASSEFIFSRVRELSSKYDNVQFLFVNGRQEASQAVMKILSAGNLVRTADLQLAYDRKNF